MTDRTLILRDMGFWRDDVGSRFEKAATDSTHKFNEATAAIYEHIDTLATYKKDDIRYESQRSRILAKKVDFHD